MHSEFPTSMRFKQYTAEQLAFYNSEFLSAFLERQQEYLRPDTPSLETPPSEAEREMINSNIDFAQRILKKRIRVNSRCS